jgi:Spy/CpxP family protein refolding chaperone
MMTKDTKVRLGVGLVVGALVVGTIAIGVTYAQQQPGPPRGGMAMGARGMMGQGPLMAMRRGLAKLGLSDQQKEQIKGIVAGHKDRMKTLADQMRTARRALGDAIANDADEPTIRQKSADLAKVQADLAVFGAQVRKEVFGALTPDQQAKAKALRMNALGRIDRFVARHKKALGF